MTNKEQAVSDAMLSAGRGAWQDYKGFSEDRVLTEIYLAMKAASHPLEQQQAVSGDVEWHPRIGEEVIVVPENCEPWGNDWRAADGTPLVVFVAGISALRGGGMDIAVSETWPLKPRGAFDADSLTDGFIIGRDEGLDQLRPLHPRAALTASGMERMRELLDDDPATLARAGVAMAEALADQDVEISPQQTLYVMLKVFEAIRTALQEDAQTTKR